MRVTPVGTSGSLGSLTVSRLDTVEMGRFPILSGVSLIGQTLIGMAVFAVFLLDFCYSNDWFADKYMKYRNYYF
ncbi:hypothetical protein [Pseudomonas protegens]|jgi:hypothetical protein|uniref:hypothetical protein n=1 Tax=Pseudomonas protegens TaxID=380021 RepID=UPI0011CE46F7|nr:hypothetical protein [Pseudomonas protegens]